MHALPLCRLSFSQRRVCAGFRHCFHMQSAVIASRRAETRSAGDSFLYSSQTAMAPDARYTGESGVLRDQVTSPNRGRRLAARGVSTAAAGGHFTSENWSSKQGRCRSSPQRASSTCPRDSCASSSVRCTPWSCRSWTFPGSWRTAQPCNPSSSALSNPSRHHAARV